ncbi:carboxypeptidase-like regulatory domain-containing protein [Phocaeicola salanitronis]|uniref:carboxypeptidase-like regulatory domain-containing protein n=1 Tax=Phocaeicola salanitronis TaxID=376805 RepID=UPI0023F6C669|nr:carboxypeptidase-like regulatory domain-containing protein [Phocaeicola salanitronis]
MRQILFFLLCLCAASILPAQTYTGKVTDEKNQPLPYANVVLLSLPDSAFVTGTVSDESGAFALKTNRDNLLLRISSIGYATLYN